MEQKLNASLKTRGFAFFVGSLVTFLFVGFAFDFFGFRFSFYFLLVFKGGVTALLGLDYRGDNAYIGIAWDGIGLH